MPKLSHRPNLHHMVVGLVIAVFVLLLVDLISFIHRKDDHDVSYVSFQVSRGADFINIKKRHNKHVTEPRNYPSHSSDRQAKEKASKDKLNLQIDKATTLNYTKEKLDKDLLSNSSLSKVKRLKEGRILSKEEFSKWASQNVSSFKQPAYVINGTSVCKNDTELIILMPAVPDHQFTRNIIRNTWAGVVYGIPWPQKKMHLKTSLAFIFGTKNLPSYKVNALSKESKIYHDVVAADFIDSYGNLSKKMMVGLDWVSRYCPQARYVLKCDLDTFINLPLLTKLLPKLSEQVPRFIIGHKHSLTDPPVVRNGRWAVSSDVYSMGYYPSYVIGASYVMTADIVPSIVSMAHTVPLIPVEDAYITGVIAHILGVPRLHHPGFAHLYKMSLPCAILYNRDFTMAKMDISRLLLMWRYIELNNCPGSELPFVFDKIVE